jgi:hypothetical protein
MPENLIPFCESFWSVAVLSRFFGRLAFLRQRVILEKIR